MSNGTWENFIREPFKEETQFRLFLFLLLLWLQWFIILVLALHYKLCVESFQRLETEEMYRSAVRSKHSKFYSRQLLIIP
jgi:hypothetical protein